MITQDQLQQRLHYDPETGVFTRKNVSRWHARCTGAECTTLDTDGYIVISLTVDGRKRLHKAHRLAWLYVTGSFPDGPIDHRNRVRTDNRFRNLRCATSELNNQNRGVAKNNTSGVTGVRFNIADGRWRAAIQAEKKYVFLGLFDNFDDAVAARLRAEDVYHPRKYRAKASS